MNLYLISQNTHNGYDTYDSAVVCAHDSGAARLVHPDRDAVEDWPLDRWKLKCWVHPDRVMVELIGVAREGIPAGVVCASFNAG